MNAKAYDAAKARYPRHLCLFRVGDFFELYHDDAKTASRALGLTLTARRDAPKVPMAAIIAHGSESYIARLLKNGYTVAILDEAEGSSCPDVQRMIAPGVSAAKVLTTHETKVIDAFPRRGAIHI